MISRLLRHGGYSVVGVPDGGELMERVRGRRGYPIDLVLLDTAYPVERMPLCPAIRQDIPVFLIGTRDEEEDLIAGLDDGADDYVLKPIHAAALLSRIRAVMRRTCDVAARSASMTAPRGFTLGWRYLMWERALYAPSGDEVALTAAEHELLMALLNNPHRTIGRERLLELTRNRIGGSNDRSIDVLVSRLRSKIGDARRSASIIRTVRGLGYMFVADLETS